MRKWIFKSIGLPFGQFVSNPARPTNDGVSWKSSLTGRRYFFWGRASSMWAPTFSLKLLLFIWTMASVQHKVFQNVRSTCCLSGLIFVAKKCKCHIWLPIQVICWLGIICDFKNNRLFIPPEKISQFFYELVEVTSCSSVSARKLAHVTGTLLSHKTAKHRNSYFFQLFFFLNTKTHKETNSADNGSVEKFVASATRVSRRGCLDAQSIH